MVAFGIASIALVMAAILVAALYRHALSAAVAVAAILVLEWMLASAGILHQWENRPPPFMVMMAVLFALTLWLGVSQTGAKIAATTPLHWLIATQIFRFPLELVMHRAAMEGMMPVQMSYSGSNFDIVTGITAIAAALLVQRGIAVRAVALGWNILGLALLANIVQIAVRSTPVFRAYGEDRLNTWIANPPYMWLPGVLVPIALLGHILIFRAQKSTFNPN